MEIKQMKVGDLVPYLRNAKKHDQAQIDNVAQSIKEFGIVQPIVVDKDNNIIIGHCRLLACKKLKLREVPVVKLEDLTPEEANKLRLLDNKLNESEWDFGLLAEDIPVLDFNNYEIDWALPESWFDRKEKDGDKRQEGNDEYNAFLDKFEDAKTTDDCYTPPNIYEAVADWVCNEYNVKKETFIRPFYPGGNYQGEKYEGKIVVDNPPFSILSEIETWYNEHGVKYFLFAPSLTNLPSNRKCCAVCTGVNVTYENKATVSTSFVTNLEDYAVRSAPDLYKIVDTINKENTRGRNIPTYEYPVNLVTTARIAYLSKYGQDLKIAQKDCSEKIGMLDAQREIGKGIFGGGLLISEKAAAEKAEAEKAALENAIAQKAEAEKAALEKADAQVWKLSEREKAIIASFFPILLALPFS